jgi:hypothetical protein
MRTGMTDLLFQGDSCGVSVDVVWLAAVIGFQPPVTWTWRFLSWGKTILFLRYVGCLRGFETALRFAIYAVRGRS